MIELHVLGFCYLSYNSLIHYLNFKSKFHIQKLLCLKINALLRGFSASLLLSSTVLNHLPDSHDLCCLLLLSAYVLGGLYCKQYGPRSDCSHEQSDQGSYGLLPSGIH